MTSPLLGTWRLRSFQLIDEKIGIQDALGPNPIGYLVYTAEGTMSVQMMSAKRELIPENDLSEASLQEKANLVDTFRSYAGTYRIEGDKVIHCVQVGLVSNWVGTEMIRNFERDGKILTLRGATSSARIKQDAVLVWEKI